MPPAFTRAVGRLALLPPARRGPRAASLVAANPPWASWAEALNALHHRDPAREVVAAGALAAAARRGRRRDLAARFLLLEARGRLRSGSPREAAAGFARAARALATAGMPERAAQARVAAVDALAHAGRPRAALRAADVAARRITGPGLAAWRAFLAINRANALRLLGDLDGARRGHEGAARAFERRRDAANAAIARLNAGVAALEAGEPEAAHAAFTRAVAAFERVGRSDLVREARYDAACADVRRGRLGTAIPALESLARVHDEARLPRRAALCRMDLADALRRAGDAAGAEREALRAARGFEREGAAGEAAEARWIAAAAASTSRPARAARLAAEAERRARAAGRPALALRGALLVAAARLDAGGTAVGASVARVRRAAERLGQAEIAAEAALLGARADLRAARPRAALARFAAVARLGTGTPWLRAAAASGTALAQAALGRTAAALRGLERVCRFLERVERDLPGPWLRSSFLLGHLDPWLARVDLLLARGRLADRRAAAVLLDGLALRRFRAAARPPRPDARALRLRARLEALYDRLGRGGDGALRGAEAGGAEAARREVRRLERDLASAWRREERRAGARVSAPASPGDGVLPPLPVRTAALHVWARNGRVVGLLEHALGVEPAHDLGALEALAAEVGRLGFLARRLRVPGVSDPKALGQALEGLARRLLLPLVGRALPERLRLVLDPALPDLPWELLPVGGRPLAAALACLRVPALSARPAPGASGRGAALLALGEPDLPGVEDERRRLGRDLAVHAGPSATRAALCAALTRLERVHVAGHGFAAAEAPALGGVRLADGWFGAADLPPRIGARLVVLSACRTGGPHGPQALAWGALPSALLSAGARHVLWTADDVEDDVSARLVGAFHDRLSAGDDPERAFGAALADGLAARGHAGALLPFRLSGIPA